MRISFFADDVTVIAALPAGNALQQQIFKGRQKEPQARKNYWQRRLGLTKIQTPETATKILFQSVTFATVWIKKIKLEHS